MQESDPKSRGRGAKINDEAAKIEDQTAKFEDQEAKFEDEAVEFGDAAAKIEDTAAQPEDRAGISDATLRACLARPKSAFRDLARPRTEMNQARASELIKWAG